METINIRQFKELIVYAVHMIRINNLNITAQTPMTIEFLQWNLEMIFKIGIKVNHVDLIGYKLDFYFEGEWHKISEFHWKYQKFHC